MKTAYLYAPVELFVPEGTEKAVLSFHDGDCEAYPFLRQRVKFCYEEHGYELTETVGSPRYEVRFYPERTGEAQVRFYDRTGKLLGEQALLVRPSNRQAPLVCGDGKCREKSGAPFNPIGLNLCYPDAFAVSNGKEFGKGDGFLYVGLRQYERWMKKASENGVNFIRIWCGNRYFSPDTLDAERLKLEPFERLEGIFRLAQKYRLRVKLTFEHFRNFVDGEKKLSTLFDKYLRVGGVPCRNETWLTDEAAQNAWWRKIEAYARRFAAHPNLFAVEFWNEMNCCEFAQINKGAVFNGWNDRGAEKMRGLFPNKFVLNSFGSLDCDWSKEWYDTFPFEAFDLLQVHTYLDQGSAYAGVRENPVEAMKNAFALTREKSERIGRKILIAETGAVNDCHSSDFRYYPSDERGLILVDCVYTPLFLGGFGAGNIWHWSGRYVDGKNLYSRFKPLAELLQGVDLEKEDYESFDCSDKQAYCFVLKGHTTWLAFIRNKADNWKTVLRDGKRAKPVNTTLPLPFEAFDCAKKPIWKGETGRVRTENGYLTIEKLRYGMLLKGKIEKDG